jgi:hypothetical protein
MRARPMSWWGSSPGAVAVTLELRRTGTGEDGLKFMECKMSDVTVGGGNVQAGWALEANKLASSPLSPGLKLPGNR